MNVGGVSAGANSEGVVAGILGFGQIAGNIVIDVVHGVLDTSTRFSRQPHQVALFLAFEFERNGAHAVDGDQAPLGQLFHLLERLRGGVIVPISDDDQYTARFDGFAFHQLAVGASHIDRVK